MRLSIDWIIEGQLLYCVGQGRQDLEEALYSYKYFAHKLESGRPGGTHILLDTNNVIPMYSFRQINQASNEFLAHPNLGWLIQINAHPPMLLNMLTTAVRFALNKKLHMFKTLEATKRFLNEVDDTLPDLSRLEFKTSDIKNMLDYRIE